MATLPIEDAANEADERTKPPFLRRVRIRGYKSIAFCDVPLQPLTILVGRNAAGKSNFLDALAFLRDVMEAGAIEAVKRREGWSSVICRTSDAQRIEIEVEASFTCRNSSNLMSSGTNHSFLLPAEIPFPDLEGITFTATYLLHMSVNAHAIPTISREQLVLQDAGGKYDERFKLERGLAYQGEILHRIIPSSPWHLQAVLRPGFPFLGLIGTQPFIDFSDELRTMSFYNFQPEVMRTLQKPAPGSMLEKNGRNLASVIESLGEVEPEVVQRVREYLATIADEVKSFDNVKYGPYETVGFQLRMERPEDLVLNAVNMSDGTLRALAALIAAFQIHMPTGPSVVAIEEPETALHPAAVRTLMDALAEATQRTQILLTTHSGDLLADRDLLPAQILVVRNRNANTHITPIDPGSREIIQKELYSLAELQRMDQLELDEADLQRQAKVQAETEKN